MAGAAPKASVSGDAITIEAGGNRFVFGLKDGCLRSAEAGGVRLPLANGPRIAPAGVATGAVTVVHASAEGGYAITVRAADGTSELRWLVRPDGSLQLDARLRGPAAPVPFFGLTFDWPESRMKSVKWLGEGPYRVWKNRMHGTRFGLFRRDYNDPVPGETWAVPEFKGSFAGVRRATLAAPDATMTVESATPDLFLRLGTPRKPKENVPGWSKKAVENVFPPLPDGDVSFLAAIPPIGTKFSKPDDGGPSGKPNDLNGRDVTLRLLFRFEAVAGR